MTPQPPVLQEENIEMSGVFPPLTKGGGGDYRIVSATEEDLQSIEGIGPFRAQNLLNVLHETFVSYRTKQIPGTLSPEFDQLGIPFKGRSHREVLSHGQ